MRVSTALRIAAGVPSPSFLLLRLYVRVVGFLVLAAVAWMIFGG